MLDALPLIEVEDAVEGAHNVLDDLWRHEPPYSRSRMQHLMDLIGKFNISHKALNYLY